MMKIALKNILSYSMYISQVLIRCGNYTGKQTWGLHLREIVTYNGALHMVFVYALFVFGEVQSPQSGCLLY